MPVCLPHAALIPIYCNRAYPVRLPLPIIHGVNASAHPFGGFGLSFAVCGRADYRLPIGLRLNDVGRPHDELHPAKGGLMDRSPILEYVLPEQGWQSLVHVLWLSDADCDAVAVYGIS